MRFTIVADYESHYILIWGTRARGWRLNFLVNNSLEWIFKKTFFAKMLHVEEATTMQ